MSPSSTFPTELYENIIDLVDDEDHPILIATLRNCALTCRAWKPRSLVRLYQYIRLENVRRDKLANLLQLIEKSPHFSSLVRGLEVIWRYYPDVSSGSAATAPDSQAAVPRGTPYIQCEGLLVSLAGKFPHLRALLIERDDGSGLASLRPLALPALSTFPALTTLRLENISFVNYAGFRRALAALHNLRNLILSSVTWHSAGITHSAASSQRLPPLSFISVFESLSTQDVVLTRMCRAVSATLETLVLVQHSVHILRDFLSYSDAKPLRLTRLSTLSLRFWPSARDDISSFYDSAITFLGSDVCTRNLQAVLFYHGVSESIDDYSDSSHSVPGGSESCSKDAAGSLHRQEDDLIGALGDNVACIHLKSRVLEDALCRERWDALQTISFDFRDVEPQEANVDTITTALTSRMKAMFPRLDKRGVLKVYFSFIDESGVLRARTVDHGMCKEVSPRKGLYQA